MDSGAEYVIMDGINWLLLWYADNLTMMKQVAMLTCELVIICQILHVYIIIILCLTIDSYAVQEYIMGTGQNIRYGNVSCSGNESQLVECDYDYNAEGISYCLFYEAAVICTGKKYEIVIAQYMSATLLCSDPNCLEGTVRLVGSNVVNEGIIEYCFNNSWYTLCADTWLGHEASVVCSSFGHPRSSGMAYSLINTLYKWLLLHFMFSEVSILSEFGSGSRPLLPWILECSGREDTLIECNYTDANIQKCQQVAGVICEGEHYNST